VLHRAPERTVISGRTVVFSRTVVFGRHETSVARRGRRVMFASSSRFPEFYQRGSKGRILLQKCCSCGASARGGLPGKSRPAAEIIRELTRRSLAGESQNALVSDLETA